MKSKSKRAMRAATGVSDFNRMQPAAVRRVEANRATPRKGPLDASPLMVAQLRRLTSAFGPAIQRQAAEEEKTLQRQTPEEEEPSQMQAAEEEEPAQMQAAEEEEPGQMQAAEEEEPAQMQSNDQSAATGGLPRSLSSGIEALSGIDVSDVRVHRNSSEPKEIGAVAYARGKDIHLGPGQERHLPHEAWHIVQQRQDRVRATRQAKSAAINDDPALEKEADVMGARAAKAGRATSGQVRTRPRAGGGDAVQLKKTAKPAKAELLGLIPGTVKKKRQGASLDPQQTRADRIWKFVTDCYEENRAKGDEKLKDLNADIARYQGHVPKTGLLGKMGIRGPMDRSRGRNARRDFLREVAAKRTGYDTAFATYYGNKVEKLSAGKYRVNTEGFDPGKGESRPTPATGMYTGAYSNEFDVANSTVIASWNFAKFDDAADNGAPKRLPNSEILWQQFKLAAKEEHKSAVDQEAQVTAALEAISKITRDTVVNEKTKATVYATYPDTKNWTDQTITWTDHSSDDFKAILGTPNGRGTVYFLKDHLDQLNRTIDKIVTLSSRDIDVDFKTLV